MTTTQIAARKSLYERILELPDEEINLLERYIEDLAGHEPNEETAVVLVDSEAGRNMSRIYDDVEEMLSDLL